MDESNDEALLRARRVEPGVALIDGRIGISARLRGHPRSSTSDHCVRDVQSQGLGGYCKILFDILLRSAAAVLRA
jgi:hypothetical protein